MILEVVHNHISHGGIVLDDEDVYRSAVLLAYGNRSRRAVHDVRNDCSRWVNFPDEAQARSSAPRSRLRSCDEKAGSWHILYR